jgi:hypothetical protein
MVQKGQINIISSTLQYTEIICFIPPRSLSDVNDFNYVYSEIRLFSNSSNSSPDVQDSPLKFLPQNFCRYTYTMDSVPQTKDIHEMIFKDRVKVSIMKDIALFTPYNFVCAILYCTYTAYVLCAMVMLQMLFIIDCVK